MFHVKHFRAIQAKTLQAGNILRCKIAARIDRFAAQFGLTHAEKRVFGEIVGGKGLAAAATKLKITEMTARSHANRIFAKTGTTRQTELIRRFFEAALPGAPGA